MDVDFAVENYSRIDPNKIAYSTSYDEGRRAAPKINRSNFLPGDI